MSAYIVARVAVENPSLLKEYMTITPPIVERYRGRFIARAGATVTLEGPEETRRIVLLEFPSLSDAKAFYNSQEYAEARKLREGVAVAGRESWILKALSERDDLFRIIPGSRGAWARFAKERWEFPGSPHPSWTAGEAWVMSRRRPPPAFGVSERARRKLREGLQAWGREVDDGSQVAIARWIRANREGERACRGFVSALAG